MNLNNKLDTLRHAISLNETDNALSHLMTELDCGNFSYNYYPINFTDVSARHHVLCTTQSQPWQDHYNRQHYEQIDPILNSMRKSHLPIGWKLENELSRHGKNQKKLFSEAIDFGLRGGFAIPIHAPRGEFANLVVQDIVVLNLIDSHPDLEHELQLIAYHYHARVNHFIEVEHANKLRDPLTLREIECLRLTAQHKTAKEIAQVLKITPRTVGFHIENTLKKLQASNKYQAVTQATQAGLLR
jgi:DNA-binding CsgD family transcriptional regulator